MAIDFGPIDEAQRILDAARRRNAQPRTYDGEPVRSAFRGRAQCSDCGKHGQGLWRAVNGRLVSFICIWCGTLVAERIGDLIAAYQPPTPTRVGQSIHQARKEDRPNGPTDSGLDARRDGE